MRLITIILLLFVSILHAESPPLYWAQFLAQPAYQVLVEIDSVYPEPNAVQCVEGWKDSLQEEGWKLERTFDQNERLTEIETYLLGRTGWELYRKERMRRENGKIRAIEVMNGLCCVVGERRFTYHSSGLLERDDFMGYSTCFQWDKKGKLIEKREDNGLRITQRYDGERVQERVFYDRDQVICVQSFEENSVTVVDPGSGEKKAFYANGREKLWDCEGTLLFEKGIDHKNHDITLESYSLDERTTATTVQCQRGAWTQSEKRDGLGRRIEICYPETIGIDGKSYLPRVQWGYDFLNRPAYVIDTQGRVLRFETNLRGQVTKLYFPDGTSQSMIYDMDGTVGKMINPGGDEVCYQRDALGRVTRRIDSMGEISATYSAFMLKTLTCQGLSNFYTLDNQGSPKPISQGWEASGITEDFFYSLKKAPTFKRLKQQRSGDENWSAWFEEALSWTSSFWNVFRHDVSLFEEIHEEFEFFCHQMLGPGLFLLIGVKSEDVKTGTIGLGEVGPDVRITHINGILNTHQDCIDNVQRVSDMHGGVNVHYSYRPSEGWTHDLINCIIVKWGYTSPSAFELGRTWKKLIAEMDGKGEIIHYAHSQGGAETACARHLLTPEEQKMIIVYTFGSSRLLEDKGFKRVMNYVSRRDGVSMLDPQGYLYSLFYQPENVIFVGSSWGFPLIDHPMTNENYTKVLEDLGEEFVQRYGSISFDR